MFNYNIGADFFSEGQIMLFDKPYGWSSFDVVNKVKFAIKKRYKGDKIKVGHAGTLDPLATGLLIVCTGKKTKNIENIQAQQKEYIGSFRIGSVTASFDLETEPENFKDFGFVTNEMIYSLANSFIGESDQVPPIFSAVKIDGRRAFKYARKGKEVEIKAKKVNIYEFEITKIDLPEIYFRISCSKGTYIRSIANDFGIKLGCGAFLSSLIRTKIGNYSVYNAMNAVEFAENMRKMEISDNQINDLQ